MSKKTLVLGASTNPSRFSYKAIQMLKDYCHEVVAIGKSEGEVAGVKFNAELIPFKDIDTITLYLNPQNQEDYYGYIVGLNPKRVIFNPGTENPVLELMLNEKNVETMEACTLVLLRTKQY